MADSGRLPREIRPSSTHILMAFPALDLATKTTTLEFPRVGPSPTDVLSTWRSQAVLVETWHARMDCASQRVGEVDILPQSNQRRTNLLNVGEMRLGQRFMTLTKKTWRTCYIVLDNSASVRTALGTQG